MQLFGEKTKNRCIPFVPAGILIMISAETNDRGSPHFRLKTRPTRHQLNQFKTIRLFLLIIDVGVNEVGDVEAGVSGFGFHMCDVLDIKYGESGGILQGVLLLI